MVITVIDLLLVNSQLITTINRIRLFRSQCYISMSSSVVSLIITKLEASFVLEPKPDGSTDLSLLWFQHRGALLLLDLRDVLRLGRHARRSTLRQSGGQERIAQLCTCCLISV
jgi:hypothetical protein